MQKTSLVLIAGAAILAATSLANAQSATPAVTPLAGRTNNSVGVSIIREIPVGDAHSDRKC
jgi:uncharacterized protein YraI